MCFYRVGCEHELLMSSPQLLTHNTNNGMSAAMALVRIGLVEHVYLRQHYLYYLQPY